MKVTRSKALETAISMIDTVDMCSDWYEEAMETVIVLRKMQASIDRRKQHVTD